MEMDESDTDFDPASILFSDSEEKEEYSENEEGNRKGKEVDASEIFYTEELDYDFYEEDSKNENKKDPDILEINAGDDSDLLDDIDEIRINTSKAAKYEHALASDSTVPPLTVINKSVAVTLDQAIFCGMVIANSTRKDYSCYVCNIQCSLMSSHLKGKLHKDNLIQNPSKAAKYVHAMVSGGTVPPPMVENKSVAEVSNCTEPNEHGNRGDGDNRSYQKNKPLLDNTCKKGTQINIKAKNCVISEKEIRNYFEKLGKIQDVNIFIMNSHKKMNGLSCFVKFEDDSTVDSILDAGLHRICGKAVYCCKYIDGEKVYNMKNKNLTALPTDLVTLDQAISSGMVTEGNDANGWCNMCNVCNIKCNSLKNMSKHLQGNIHRETLIENPSKAAKYENAMASGGTVPPPMVENKSVAEVSNCTESSKYGNRSDRDKRTYQFFLDNACKKKGTQLSLRSKIITEKEIRNYFNKFGKIQDVNIFTYLSGKKSMCCFVKFEDDSSVDSILDAGIHRIHGQVVYCCKYIDGKRVDKIMNKDLTALPPVTLDQAISSGMVTKGNGAKVYCNVCNIICNTINNMSSHLQGNIHRETLIQNPSKATKYEHAMASGGTVPPPMVENKSVAEVSNCTEPNEHGKRDDGDNRSYQKNNSVLDTFLDNNCMKGTQINIKDKNCVISEIAIRNYFDKFGKIQDVEIFIMKKNKKMNGLSCFVKFEDDSSVDSILDAGLHRICGKVVNCCKYIDGKKVDNMMNKNLTALLPDLVTLDQAISSGMVTEGNGANAYCNVCNMCNIKSNSLKNMSKHLQGYSHRETLIQNPSKAAKYEHAMASGGTVPPPMVENKSVAGYQAKYLGQYTDYHGMQGGFPNNYRGPQGPGPSSYQGPHGGDPNSYLVPTGPGPNYQGPYRPGPYDYQGSPGPGPNNYQGAPSPGPNSYQGLSGPGPNYQSQYPDYNQAGGNPGAPYPPSQSGGYQQEPNYPVDLMTINVSPQELRRPGIDLPATSKAVTEIESKFEVKRGYVSGISSKRSYRQSKSKSRCYRRSRSRSVDRQHRRSRSRSSERRNRRSRIRSSERSNRSRSSERKNRRSRSRSSERRNRRSSSPSYDNRSNTRSRSNYLEKTQEKNFDNAVSEMSPNDMSVEGACQLLMSSCENIGILGHTMRATLENTQKFGNDSSKILASLCNPESQELLVVIADKFKSLYTGTQDRVLQNIYIQASIGTNYLLESTKFHLKISKLFGKSFQSQESTENKQYENSSYSSNRSSYNKMEMNDKMSRTLDYSMNYGSSSTSRGISNIDTNSSFGNKNSLSTRLNAIGSSQQSGFDLSSEEHMLMQRILGNN